MTNITKKRYKFYSPNEDMHKAAAHLVNQVTKLLVDFIENLDLPEHIQTKLITKEKKPTNMFKFEVVVNTVIPKHKFPQGLRTISRDAELVRYKHVTWFILRQMGNSYPTTASHFNMHHSAIMHGVKKITIGLKNNEDKIMKTYYKVLTIIQEEYDRNI